MWSKEWPTAPGWYWFYGQHYGLLPHRLGTVRVFPIQNGVGRVLDGQFMYVLDKHNGVFMPIDVPVIPSEIAGGNFDA